MRTFTVGERVSVPCSLKPGPLRGEYLITVLSVDGPVSGFVKEPFILRYGTNPFVMGTVVAVDIDTMTVDIPGSFFQSASGRTLMRSDWASENLLTAVG